MEHKVQYRACAINQNVLGRQAAGTPPPQALVESQHPSGVVHENQSGNLLAHPAGPHTRDDPRQDVVKTVTTVALQSMLRADIVRQQNVALLAFRHDVLDHFDPFVIGASG